MTLEIRHVTKKVAGETHIDDVSLDARARHARTSCSGRRSSGKTSADAADGRASTRRRAGKVFFDGKDVTGVPVRRRRVAMVYQQFINYPT